MKQPTAQKHPTARRCLGYRLHPQAERTKALTPYPWVIFVTACNLCSVQTCFSFLKRIFVVFPAALGELQQVKKIKPNDLKCV